MNKEEHAKRIIAKPLAEKKNLLFLARKNKYWSHVDWDLVEKNILEEEKNLKKRKNNA